MSLSQWLKPVLFTSLLTISVSCYADTADANFSPTQQAAIQKIVHDYLVSNPQVLIEVANALQKQQQTQLQNTATKVVPPIAQQLFANPNSPVTGNVNGDVTLVEFFDYQCPHCKDMAPEVADLIKNDPNLRVVFKELPIFGDDSQYAAKAALAAQKQGKFLPFHQALLGMQTRLTPDAVLQIAGQVGLNTQQLQTDMKSSDVTQEIKDNYAYAKQLQFVGTPAFVIAKVFVDNKTQKATVGNNTVIIPGAVDEPTIAQAISQVRSGA